MVGSCISFLIYNNDGGGCEMDLFFSSFLNVFVIIIEIRECVVVGRRARAGIWFDSNGRSLGVITRRNRCTEAFFQLTRLNKGHRRRGSSRSTHLVFGFASKKYCYFC